MEIKNLSVQKINEQINEMKLEESAHLIPLLINDPRTSVNKLGQMLIKKVENYIKEKERIKKLWEIETNLLNTGKRMIAGIDEAGRGPLAGPVVACAVILPPQLTINGVDDSKKITEKKREELFNVIQEKAISIGIGIVDNQLIDSMNIFKATQLAMKKAVENLKVTAEYLLIDAVKLTDINIEQKSIVHGDSLSISIAAASIIAKVTRDRIMYDLHKVYPYYGFAQHKGYGTKEHYQGIQQYGISPIHRKSFLKNILGDDKWDENQSI